MKETKDHLNINLEFLDKKEPLRISPKNDSSGNAIPAQSTHKWNWKNILIVIGVILFFVWIANSGDNSTSSASSNSSSSTGKATSSSGTVGVGEYSCTKYYDDELSKKEIELNNLKRSIELSSVNENSSQFQINQYNAMVDKYNVQKDAYNNYLKTNCTKN